MGAHRRFQVCYRQRETLIEEEIEDEAVPVLRRARAGSHHLVGIEVQIAYVRDLAVRHSGLRAAVHPLEEVALALARRVVLLLEECEARLAHHGETLNLHLGHEVLDDHYLLPA